MALAVIWRGDELLLEIAFDGVKGEHFARPPGGGIEFGERAEQAVCREIREELGLTLIDTRVLTILENIFVYEGTPGHEVVFMVEGRLAEEHVYKMEEIPAREGPRASFLRWLTPLHVLGDGWQLHPGGFPEFLGLRRPESPPAGGPAS